MNINGPVTEGLAQLNYHMQYEHKGLRDRVPTSNCQGLFEEYASQINNNMEDLNDGLVEEFQVQVQAHSQTVLLGGQQPYQGPRWERFLPLRTIKVLLVENDDSTCYIVSALLRNCGYEVMAARNGLHAWKILEDLTNHIDLVLTEVVMPSVSGIALLCKIMSHKSFKNIPVIMMSSHDSMNMVFKCLSKGAIDFLVKPIRKNELKNLWQHVWRKCASSGGSGSECGMQTKKSRSSRSAEESDNDSGSNDDNGFGSIHLDVRDGSDHGSVTQSSCTKRVVEAGNPDPVSPNDQISSPFERPGVKHSSPQTRCNNWVSLTATRGCKEQDDELGHSLDNDLTCTDLVRGQSRIPYLQLESQREKMLINKDGTKKGKFAGINSKKDAEERRVDINCEKQTFQSWNLAADSVGGATTSSHTQMKTIIFDIPNGLSNVCAKHTGIYDNHEMPSLELSLKRTRDIGDTGTSAYDQNIFSHSYLSAFSRYSSASTANETPAGNAGSSSPLHNSSKERNAEALQNFQSNSDCPPNQSSNGSSNNNDMGSSTNNIFAKAAIDKLAPISTAEHIHNISAFHPVQNSHTSPCQPAVQNVADAAIGNRVLPQEKGSNQQVQVEHHYHHHHYHHHHVRGMIEQPERDDLTTNNIAGVPLCRSSDVLNEAGEGNAGNHSWNDSASVTNHGGNAQNEKNTLNARVTNMESDNTITVKGRAIGGIGYGNKNGVDQSRLSQREAALNKFRQKRKDRCFMKKVRYQSRKELAEQRPRVRGQFVRQVVYDNRGKDTLLTQHIHNSAQGIM